jgi:hypothetical protein
MNMIFVHILWYHCDAYESKLFLSSVCLGFHGGGGVEVRGGMGGYSCVALLALSNRQEICIIIILIINTPRKEPVIMLFTLVY